MNFRTDVDVKQAYQMMEAYMVPNGVIVNSGPRVCDGGLLRLYITWQCQLCLGLCNYTQ